MSLRNKITDVVIQHHSRRLLNMDILMFETCWANISEIKTTSDIKLLFNSSSIKASAHFSGVFYTFQTCPCSHTKFHSSCKKLSGKYERKYSCILCNRCYLCGPGSWVGIETELRAGRSGIESRCGRDFPPVHTGPGAHPASCKMGTGCFPGDKVRPGRAADH